MAAACGVNHTTAFSFPNIAYKSAQVNAFSALSLSSVDASRLSSCKSSGWSLNGSRRRRLSTISFNRVHGENKRYRASPKQCCSGAACCYCYYCCCCCCCCCCGCDAVTKTLQEKSEHPERGTGFVGTSLTSRNL
jgi:hypothetical protein